MSAYPRPPRRLTVALDLGLLAWVAAWIVIAIFVAREVHGLRQLSSTVALAGGALRQTGDLLGSLEGVPVVGDNVGDLAGRVEQTGRSAQRSARASRDSIEDLAVLLGISIALIPSVPLVAVYLPLRLSWRREGRAIQRALRRGDDRLDRFLAFRATQNLPYERLLEVSPDPWLDLREGRYRDLADAELDRLGLPRPAPRPR